MAKIKYFQKLHAHVILKNLPTKKSECVEDYTALKMKFSIKNFFIFCAELYSQKKLYHRCPTNL